MRKEPETLVDCMDNFMHAVNELAEDIGYKVPTVKYTVKITETITRTTEVVVSMPIGSYYDAIDQVRLMHLSGEIAAQPVVERSVEYENLGSDYVEEETSTFN